MENFKTENFKAMQEYLEKMKNDTEEALDSLRKKEYSHAEKCMAVGGLFFFGILIGMCIGAHRQKKRMEEKKEQKD